MNEQRRLMFIGAHPDDETLGAGPVLARFAAEGASVSALIATRGQRGWAGEPSEYPGPDALGRLREGELRAAASVLGIGELILLDYMDGDLRDADQLALIGEVVDHLRRARPQVVVTFDPWGNYGHPDHIVMVRATQAAVVAAADPSFPDGPPHRVDKLYYMVDTPAIAAGFRDFLGGDIEIVVDDVTRSTNPWPEWGVTTWIDTSAHRDRAIAAVACHASQLPIEAFRAFMAEPSHAWLWREMPLVRAYSLVDAGGGQRIETDLFAGIV